MFKSGCCGGSTNGEVVVEMEKQDKESQEKDKDVETKGESDETVYKLKGFNERIDTEALRFIFHIAGASFEDDRVDKDGWLEIQNGVKWGKLPVLQVDDISIYSSTAIGRFLGKRFHLVGKDEMESVRCDEYVEVCQDLRAAWKEFFDEEDETKKSEAKDLFQTTTLPEVLSKLNEDIEENAKTGGSWLIGDDCTWADLFLANLLEIFEETVDPDLLNEYSALKNLKEAVFNIPEIVAYIQTRPETLC